MTLLIVDSFKKIQNINRASPGSSNYRCMLSFTSFLFQIYQKVPLNCLSMAIQYISAIYRRRPII